MAKQETKYLTPTAVAQMLLVSPVTVRQWAQKGMLPATTTAGGHRRFARADVEQFAAERNMVLAEQATSVLVVDDDQQLNSYLVALLQVSVEGIEVYSAADGFAAGRMVAQHRPSVVVLDIMMPGMDGVQVCRSIKDDIHSAHAHVVAMTGHYTTTLEERVLAAGASVLLKKPFDSNELLTHCGFSSTSNKSQARHGET